MRAAHAATMVTALGGLVLSGVLTVVTWSINQANEDRLLDQRVREAGAVVEASLPSIQTPLAAAAELAEAEAGEDALIGLMDPQVGEGRRFVSVSVWRLDSPSPLPVLTVGAPPALADQPPEQIRSLLNRSADTQTMAVVGLLNGNQPRLGYALSSPRSPARFVAYAESPLPADRTSAVNPDNAFSGLDFAIYLGGVEESDQLVLASTDRLPIGGRRSAQSILFGDSALLLIMTPTGQLGGGLLAALPWLLLTGGSALTMVAAALVQRLARSRDQAQRLAAENAGLYEEQHRVAHTLQHSLLPQSLPAVAGAELAVRYTPGVKGMDIGGDWYDAINVGQHHLVLIVGDVSGRGLRAASAMAALRFAARAFASQGDDPATVLRKLNQLTDADPAGHFATAVCVLVDLDTHTASAASAGHPCPILLDGDRSRFIATPVGQPIGVKCGPGYARVDFSLPASGTLLLYTDGLFERRGESIDVGLERLRHSAARATGRGLDAMLDTLIGDLSSDEVADDVAILGLRW